MPSSVHKPTGDVLKEYRPVKNEPKDFRILDVASDVAELVSENSTYIPQGIGGNCDGPDSELEISFRAALRDPMILLVHFRDDQFKVALLGDESSGPAKEVATSDDQIISMVKEYEEEAKTATS